MKTAFLGLIPFGDVGDGDGDGDGDGGGGGGDGDGGGDGGDGGDSSDGVCVWGIHHRPHLVKHSSDLLKHRANVQDVLKAPRRSTMQEGPSLDS